ncbi:MAG TPA: GNAT family N-acetyltransferase [Methylibium sp.]|nr:GNAT family N-acetyltransferase [Methylibium sp.]
MDWTLYDDPDGADRIAARLIDTGLGEANDAAAPLHEVRPLACHARDAAGQTVGGAVGRTWGACCELQQLWVTPARRRGGIGAALVRRFEALAAQRGCTVFYLETFSFQAPALYRRLGYEVVATIAGFAPGVEKHLMVRRQNSSRLAP